MAKSKSSRIRGPVCTNNNNNNNNKGPISIQAKPKCASSNIEITHEAIERHWSALPPQAKSFILNHTNDGIFSLSQLLQFWSRPANIESTQGSIAGSICGATWYLALVYLKLNRFKEARALTIHGSFIHQCYNSSLEYIRDLYNEARNEAPEGITHIHIPERQLSYFARGCSSISSPQTMKSYIEAYLPKEYTQMMTSFANLSSKKNVMGYIDQISDDWKSTSSKNHHRSSSSSKNGGTQLELIFEDDSNEDEHHSFGVSSSTELKSLFNDYADKRGISLRCLRFSYAGKMLFLSSAGHKTPEELGMQDHDVIKVHDTSLKHQESSDDESSSFSQKARTSSKKTKAKKSKGKKTKAKKQQQRQQAEPTKTLEEFKVDHSKQLTKIHEEAQAQFKQIRQRLNNLVIERSQPKKKKSKRPRAKQVSSLQSIVSSPFKEGLGGKAGKSHYDIQVGEVQNLYKTTKKPSTLASNQCTSLSTLDLHGCTKEEALTKLDDTLKVWADTAMEGSYPFVQPATIVCGCGNQILSEVVQEWIRENDKVRNAPKFGSSRQRVLSSRAA